MKRIWKGKAMILAMVLLVSMAASAHAAHTTLKVQVYNGDVSDKITVWDNKDSETKTVKSGDTHVYTDNDTAYYWQTKRYDHTLTLYKVKNSGEKGSKYCTISLWITNNTTVFGKAKLHEYNASSDNSACTLKDKGISDKKKLTIEVTIH